MKTVGNLLQRSNISCPSVYCNAAELPEQPSDQSVGKQLLLGEEAELGLTILYPDQNRVGIAAVITDKEISARYSIPSASILYHKGISSRITRIANL